MNLSKSKYCLGLQCPKLLWLNEYKNSEKNQDVNQDILDTGVEVGKVAQGLFNNINVIEYNQNLNDMLSKTNELLKEKNINIAEASFKFDNLFCSIDILKKEGDSLEIYEVKSSTELKDIYIDDASFQYYILSKLGYRIKSVNIIYLNSSYVKKGKINLNELFITCDITDKCIEKLDYVKENIEKFNMVLNMEEIQKEISIDCMKPYECPFFEYCTRNLKKPNIFDIKRMQSKTKFKLYNNGIYEFKDLINLDIDNLYKEQVQYELFEMGEKIEKEKIADFLNELYYPLYFLDFETYQSAIPEYDGTSPFMQIPFQYSLHIYKNKTANLEHKEFLGNSGTDARRKLAESLCNDIPKNVCTIAYNMMFEKMVIKNLANLYPDLSDHLMNIHNNMKDLMIPFKDRYFYNKAMQGSYSIKYVLPALFPNDPSLNYHNLEDVHNGKEAMNIYKELPKYNKEEQNRIRNNLLKYCELDTLAMVKIYDKLKEVTGGIK